MDHELFDAWTRSLVASNSRRRALKTVAGGALGGLLTRLGVGETAAACAAHAKKCKAGGGCCSGFCERKGKCAKNGKLTGKCRCRCPQGTAECGTKGCCGAGEECQGGACVPAAGACTPACTGGQECEAGACACPEGTANSCNSATGRVCHCCPVGLVHCGGGICRGCCGHLDCDGNRGLHCDLNFGGDGQCVCQNGVDHQCEAGGFCLQCCSEDDCYAYHGWSGGQVICTAPGSPGGGNLCRCDQNFAMCGGAPKFCTNTKTDPLNCGFCGNRCHNGTTCVGGECVLR